jgi:hypothetical protein
MAEPEFAEIVARRFRIERTLEGGVDRIYVEGVNAKGRLHWFLAWTTNRAWATISRLDER